MVEELKKTTIKPKVRVGNFTSLGVKNRDWRCYPVDGETLADVCDPAYWGVVVQALTIGDRIFCLAETQEWCAELLVVDKTDTWAQVTVLSHADLTKASVQGVDAAATVTPDDFTIKYAAGKGYRIVRRSDNLLIKDGLSTKAEAKASLDAYILTVTRS